MKSRKDKSYDRGKIVRYKTSQRFKKKYSFIDKQKTFENTI